MIPTAADPLTPGKAKPGKRGSCKHPMNNLALQKPSDGYLHYLDRTDRPSQWQQPYASTRTCGSRVREPHVQAEPYTLRSHAPERIYRHLSRPLPLVHGREGLAGGGSRKPPKKALGLRKSPLYKYLYLPMPGDALSAPRYGVGR